jgi:hypothetical protein
LAVEEGQHTSIRAFIKRHAVLVFYVLVFALIFGGMLIDYLRTGSFLGTDDYGSATSPADVPVTVLALVAGNSIFALVGILVITLAYGRVGLRDLGARLFRWRMGVRWYAVALLTAPLLMAAILFALSLTSKAFLPGIITAEDKASLLVAGLVAELVAAFFESSPG